MEIKKAKQLVLDENKRLLKTYGVDMTTQYGSYVAEDSTPENIKACSEAGVDINTESGSYVARFFTKQMIKENFTTKKMTVKEICEELGYDIEIVK